MPEFGIVVVRFLDQSSCVPSSIIPPSSITIIRSIWRRVERRRAILVVCKNAKAALKRFRVATNCPDSAIPVPGVLIFNDRKLEKTYHQQKPE